MTVTARKLYFELDPAVPDPILSRMEESFFSAIRLSNGTFKTTRSNRLDNVNAMVIDYLLAEGIRPRAFLDIAASSGRGTAEWIAALRGAGFEPEVTATDLCLSGYLVDLTPGFAALVDREGRPLQFEVLGRAFRPWKRRLDYVTGYVLVSRLMRAAFRRAFRPDRLRAEARGVRPISLVSPRVAGNTDITFVDDDVTQDTARGLAGRFDLARATNILNLEYFPRDRLARAAAILRRRLRGPGAHLLVCRTRADQTNHATLFRLGQDGAFAPVRRVGEGSEVEDIITSLPPRARES